MLAGVSCAQEMSVRAKGNDAVARAVTIAAYNSPTANAGAMLSRDSLSFIRKVWTLFQCYTLSFDPLPSGLESVSLMYCILCA